MGGGGKGLNGDYASKRDVEKTDARFKRNLLCRYHRNKPGERPNELSGTVRSNFLYRERGKPFDHILSAEACCAAVIIISLVMQTDNSCLRNFL